MKLSLSFGTRGHITSLDRASTLYIEGIGDT